MWNQCSYTWAFRYRFQRICPIISNTSELQITKLIRRRSRSWTLALVHENSLRPTEPLGLLFFWEWKEKIFFFWKWIFKNFSSFSFFFGSALFSAILWNFELENLFQKQISNKPHFLKEEIDAKKNWESENLNLLSSDFPKALDF